MTFQIKPYSKPNLISLLSLSSLADPQSLNSDQHVQYFDHYLPNIGVRTILRESLYIDKDFLEDYAHYYVRCFPDYERKCSRLHFFDFDITDEDFNGILSNPTQAALETLSNGYLGFTVIKKLPMTIFGRTCLRTYAEDDGRQFPTVHEYKTHLFGISLSVTSLAFQEQDQVAAACATSCLWSIFHATGKLFQHPIYSPVEITRTATVHMPAQSRVFPNDSLNVEQMAQAIRHVELEPHFVSVFNQDYLLKSTIYAYARGGIPIALVVYLVDTSNNPNIVDGVQHAMAVSGYRVADVPPTPVGGSGFLSVASCIDKIYCHDDQIGPFAKMEFDGTPVTINGNGFPSLTTSWKGSNGIIGSKRAVANLVLVPLYHKIRIPLALIEQPVFVFDALIEEFRINKLLSLQERINWDIFLQQQHVFKKEILSDTVLENATRVRIATSSMPRFIWRARALSEKRPIVDLIFDATDIAQSGCFHSNICYDKKFSDELLLVLNDPTTKAKVFNSRASNIFKSF